MASSLEADGSATSEEQSPSAIETTRPPRGEDVGAERNDDEEVSYDEVVYGMESFQAIYRPGMFVALFPALAFVSLSFILTSILL